MNDMVVLKIEELWDGSIRVSFRSTRTKRIIGSIVKHGFYSWTRMVMVFDGGADFYPNGCIYKLSTDN